MPVAGFALPPMATVGGERFDGVKGGEPMPTKSSDTGARAGDWIECRGVHGEALGRGEIIELLGGEGDEHDRVRWDEKHGPLSAPPTA